MFLCRLSMETKTEIIQDDPTPYSVYILGTVLNW